jgi:integrase
MSRSRTPAYRRHRPSGQAVVTVKLPDGGRKDIYLGKWNTAASRREYARIVGELAAAPTPAAVVLRIDRPGLSVNELCAAFWRWATGYYAPGCSERETYRLVIRALRQSYGHTRAEKFGPLALEAVRKSFVAAGLSRGEVNRRVRMSVKIFKWGVAKELVTQPVHAALQTVEGLRVGHSPAPDRPQKSVPSHADVAAIYPFVSQTVKAMISVQLLTGMRPGELVQLRPVDLVTSGPAWRFVPKQHKTAHRGKCRTIMLGPKAQAILASLTPDDPTGYYFDPAAAVLRLREQQRAGRQTPLWNSHVETLRRKRSRRPVRTPGSRYSTSSYSRAVRRGIELTNARREHLAGPGNYDSLDWHVHQLRHLAAATIRERFGLETVRATLGHSALAMSGHYAASADAKLSEAAALAVG